MGIDYHTCANCEEPLTMYDGGSIWNCKKECQNWICYYCIKQDSLVRGCEDEECDGHTICPVCKSEESEKDIYADKLNAIIDKMKTMKISKKNIEILKKDIKNLI